MLHRNEIQRWEMRYKDGVQKMLQDIDKPLWLTTKSQSKVIQIQSQKCKKKKKSFHLVEHLESAATHYNKKTWTPWYRRVLIQMPTRSTHFYQSFFRYLHNYYIYFEIYVLFVLYTSSGNDCKLSDELTFSLPTFFLLFTISFLLATFFLLVTSFLLWILAFTSNLFFHFQRFFFIYIIFFIYNFLSCLLMQLTCIMWVCCYML